ncbi:hypothetical protein [Nocardia abscessus]|uniref:hypothetical protein n=1 Tax=Nocardia abscessus TaxID=120957 RepID=UPI00245839F9|nr:hypothetical protein [Nocardia abscessus]
MNDEFVDRLRSLVRAESSLLPDTACYITGSVSRGDVDANPLRESGYDVDIVLAIKDASQLAATREEARRVFSRIMARTGPPWAVCLSTADALVSGKDHPVVTSMTSRSVAWDALDLTPRLHLTETPHLGHRHTAFQGATYYAAKYLATDDRANLWKSMRYLAQVIATSADLGNDERNHELLHSFNNGHLPGAADLLAEINRISEELPDLMGSSRIFLSNRTTSDPQRLFFQIRDLAYFENHGLSQHAAFLCGSGS